jgi:hypothetical protein
VENFLNWHSSREFNTLIHGEIPIEVKMVSGDAWEGVTVYVGQVSTFAFTAR